MKLLELKTAEDEFNFLSTRCTRLKKILSPQVPDQTLAVLAVTSLSITSVAVFWALYRLPAGVLPFSIKKHLEQLIKYSST